MVTTTKYQDDDLVRLLREEIGLDLDAALIVDWVADNFVPEDVFSEAALSYWAEQSGYVIEEE